MGKHNLLLQTNDSTTRNTLEHSFESRLATCKAQGWNEANTHKNKHKTRQQNPSNEEGLQKGAWTGEGKRSVSIKYNRVSKAQFVFIYGITR